MPSGLEKSSIGTKKVDISLGSEGSVISQNISPMKKSTLAKEKGDSVFKK
jgi:hypothetical protein